MICSESENQLMIYIFKNRDSSLDGFRPDRNAKKKVIQRNKKSLHQLIELSSFEDEVDLDIGNQSDSSSCSIGKNWCSAVSDFS